MHDQHMLTPPHTHTYTPAYALATAEDAAMHDQHMLTPPHTHTYTPAYALATAEDAAMHDQYVRVITPEPTPTEETEEASCVS